MKHELKAKFFGVFYGILDVVIPGICANCGKEVKGPKLLCVHCAKSVIIRKAPTKLGNRFLFAATDYKDPAVQNLIKTMKYDRVWKAGKFLSEMMLKHLDLSGFTALIPKEKEAFIVPIPMHFIKRWKRGFNQSEILAANIGRELRIPVIKALKRDKWTPPQSNLKDDSLRSLNIKDCFSLSGKARKIPRGSVIIILDDVVTSGETMKEAARIMRPLHPSQIIFVSVASR
ncbi:MAG: phosphoribosyltransferase family protein [Parcubacteria group bacterium]